MRRRQLGATAVEFALVLIIYLTFFLGIVDFVRMLWTWSAANEATRWGARVATVCDRNTDMARLVLTRMQQYLPQLTSSNVQIDWFGAANTVNNSCTNLPGTALVNQCTGVTVRITSLNYQWISPIFFSNYAAITMPSFVTYLPIEIMGQDPNSSSVCPILP